MLERVRLAAVHSNAGVCECDHKLSADMYSRDKRMLQSSSQEWASQQVQPRVRLYKAQSNCKKSKTCISNCVCLTQHVK